MKKSLLSTDRYGYCECGCGQKTELAKQTDKRKGWIKGKPLRFIYQHQTKGKQGHHWKGGKIIDIYGYKMIWKPNHQRANVSGYVKEHILIAEKALGKPIPLRAVVHHHNTVQLVICQDQSYHMRLHLRQRALQECGYVDWRKCNFCGEYDSPSNLYISKSNEIVCHRECRNIYQRTNRKIFEKVSAVHR